MNPKQIDDLYNKVAPVEGWLWNFEPVALIQLPLLVDHVPGAIVEIGSYCGKSTIALGSGSIHLSQSKRPIYCIDPFIPDNRVYVGDYFQVFWNHIAEAGLTQAVVPIRKYSRDAVHDCPGSIALLFIDGDHAYEAVKEDIANYTPRVVPGGIVAFHDYSLPWCPGVTRAVDEFLQDPAYVHLCDYYSLRIIRKIR
jgi:predicted O-methyltransferase YrrM